MECDDCGGTLYIIVLDDIHCSSCHARNSVKYAQCELCLTLFAVTEINQNEHQKDHAVRPETAQ